MNQAKTDGLKSIYQQKLNALTKSRKVKRQRVRSEALLTEWYYPAVLFFIDQKPASISAQHIAIQIGISVSAAHRCLDHLIRSGFASIENNIYIAKPRYFIFDDPRDQTQTKRSYAKGQIQRSLKAIDHAYGKGAKFHSRTLTIQKNQFEAFHQKLNSAIEDLISETETRPGEDVLQINLQVFRLSDIERE